MIAVTPVDVRRRAPVVKDAKDASLTLLAQVILSISSALVAHTVAATLAVALTLLQVVPARPSASVVILALVLLVPL